MEEFVARCRREAHAPRVTIAIADPTSVNRSGRGVAATRKTSFWLTFLIQIAIQSLGQGTRQIKKM